MCSGRSDQLSSKTRSSSLSTNMNDSTKSIESDVSFSNLLELAANNDVDGFKRSITRIASAINEVGLWYGRQESSKRMLMEHRTPLMIASTYGSLDVVKLILSLSEADVNTFCGPDKTTALHCAASSGADNAFDVVKVLLFSGADPESVNAGGQRPVDVVAVNPNFPGLKSNLEKLLKNQDFSGSDAFTSSLECPVDSFGPVFPDLKSGFYSSDEFRMFSFKIRACSRAYSHDWTECPFIHPGESARRRDPRKIHYSCVPCPEFKKGQCRLGDYCEFAHGVFESWLHPAQYRTRVCKDGTFCARRVCFFAHTAQELRPLYGSTGPGPTTTMSSPPFSPPPMLQVHGGSLPVSRLRLSFNGPHGSMVLNRLAPVNRYSSSGYGFDHLGPNSSDPFSPGSVGFDPTEPDVSWVQSLVKEPPGPVAPKGSELEPEWLEKMQLDQIVA